jgi:DnaJ-class molecular chaperone
LEDWMMRDPYELLGVSRKASAADIKSAYRKLAKKLHPDANKHDPKAATRFAELNAAYEIIGDSDRRKAFDRGEIDAEGKPRFQGFGRRPGFGAQPGFETFSWGREGAQRSAGGSGGSFRGFGGFEEILREAFGGAGRGGRAGSFGFEPDEAASTGDIAASLTITLPEAAKGVRKRVRLPTGKEVDVNIPAGLAEGRSIRLKGQGHPGPAGRTGDVLITVSVAPHPLFVREGADLRLELPITLYEAVLGGRIRVPTLDGAVELAIPPATSSGRTFRLKGKGFPLKEGAGDLLATVRIVLPEGSDPALEELMRKWREMRIYDPRRGMG